MSLSPMTPAEVAACRRFFAEVQTEDPTLDTIDLLNAADLLERVELLNPYARGVPTTKTTRPPWYRRAWLWLKRRGWPRMVRHRADLPHEVSRGTPPPEQEPVGMVGFVDSLEQAPDEPEDTGGPLSAEDAILLARIPERRGDCPPVIEIDRAYGIAEPTKVTVKVVEFEATPELLAMARGWNRPVLRWDPQTAQVTSEGGTGLSHFDA